MILDFFFKKMIDLIYSIKTFNLMIKLRKFINKNIKENIFIKTYS